MYCAASCAASDDAEDEICNGSPSRISNDAKCRCTNSFAIGRHTTLLCAARYCSCSTTPLESSVPQLTTRSPTSTETPCDSHRFVCLFRSAFRFVDTRLNLDNNVARRVEQRHGIDDVAKLAVGRQHAVRDKVVRCSRRFARKRHCLQLASRGECAARLRRVRVAHGEPSCVALRSRQRTQRTAAADAAVTSDAEATDEAGFRKNSVHVTDHGCCSDSGSPTTPAPSGVSALLSVAITSSSVASSPVTLLFVTKKMLQAERSEQKNMNVLIQSAQREFDKPSH